MSSWLITYCSDSEIAEAQRLIPSAPGKLVRHRVWSVLWPNVTATQACPCDPCAHKLICKVECYTFRQWVSYGSQKTHESTLRRDRKRRARERQRKAIEETTQ